MAEISPLRCRRTIDAMMIHNLSPAKQQSYIYTVTKFSRNFGRSLHLIAQQRAWSHVNQAVCSLRP